MAFTGPNQKVQRAFFEKFRTHNKSTMIIAVE